MAIKVGYSKINVQKGLNRKMIYCTLKYLQVFRQWRLKI